MSAFFFNLLFPASVFLHKKSLFFNSGFRTLALCLSVYDHLCHGSFYIALRILHHVSISFTRLDLSHRQCYLVHHCILSKTHVQQAFLFFFFSNKHFLNGFWLFAFEASWAGRLYSCQDFLLWSQVCCRNLKPANIFLCPVLESRFGVS